MRKTFRIVPISFIFILIVTSVALSACGPGQPLGPTLTPTHTPTATIDVSATSIAATENFRATLESVAATDTAIVSSTSAAKTQDAIIKAKQATATKEAQATATKEAFLAAEQSKKDIITAAEDICVYETGFPEAAKYIAQRDFHPLVLFPDEYSYPPEVAPDSLNELEIVACISESEETFRRNEYTKQSTGQSGYYCLDKVQLWTITIRGAQTGKVVHEFEARGPKPKNLCGETETIPTGQKTISRTGIAPSLTIIWEKIEDLVLLDMNMKDAPLPGTISTPQISSASSPPSCDEIGQIWISPVDGMELSCVPAGEFKMGSTESDNIDYWGEFPQHTVYLDAFWIDRTEVTNAMFAQFLNEEANQSEGGADWMDADSDYARVVQQGSEWQPVSGYGEHPVVEVTWYGAQAYCRWAGQRLPSEAEWEKAARGTDGRTYPWGEELDCAKANYSGCSGDTEWSWNFLVFDCRDGVLDMAGNVFEWVADRYDEDYYSISPYENPAGPASGKYRITRGGSWYYIANEVRTAVRFTSLPNEPWGGGGFRCARSP